MDKLVINGGTRLKGEVVISGAKNAAVAILPATLLIDGTCTIENLPNISDVKLSCTILEKLGAKITWLTENSLKIDTRKITRSIRDKGSRKVIITDISTTKEEAMEKMKNYQKYQRGIKLNIVRSLNKRKCNVTVVPYNTTAEEVISLKPDGVFLSNGPGDPEDVKEVIKLVKELKEKYPIFGICLGHQMISLAYGAKTYKLKFGHRGGNHPVLNLKTDKIEITSQNHSYAVDEESLKSTKLEPTHKNILDNTIEGVECKKDRIFSVQYHPESAPGPQDSGYLFDKFINIMKGEE